MTPPKTAPGVVLDDTSLEDVIETLSMLAEQNVILARGIQKKVEQLRDERQRRRPERREGDGRRYGDHGD